MIRIAIADDHEMFAQGISSLLTISDGFSVNILAKNGQELIAKLQNSEIDILLLDVDMPNVDGQDALLTVKKLWPQIKVIMLTMHDEASYVKRFLDLDVEGYVLKNTNREELIKAVKWVFAGNQFVTNDLLQKVNKANEIEREKESIISILTPRELEILKLSGQEFSIPDISNKLSISENTIKTHRKNILRKLNLSNSMGMVKFVMEHGLV